MWSGHETTYVPIPKTSTSSSSPSGYRLISILSTISKILEKHVHQLIFQHLCVHHPLSSKQWGFLPGRSTASALLSVTNEWLVHLENGNEVCSIFFDLKKAFDSVPHSLLLQRLVELDVNPFVVQWVRSYLTNRCQCVVVDGKQSTTKYFTNNFRCTTRLSSWSITVFDLHQ